MFRNPFPTVSSDFIFQILLGRTCNAAHSKTCREIQTRGVAGCACLTTPPGSAYDFVQNETETETLTRSV